MFYLVTREYAPRRLFFLSAIIWLSSLTGIVLVSISRGHYTIDIVIAYYVTTRIFWIYHTLAGTPSLKVRAPGRAKASTTKRIVLGTHFTLFCRAIYRSRLILIIYRAFGGFLSFATWRGTLSMRSCPISTSGRCRGHALAAGAASFGDAACIGVPRTRSRSSFLISILDNARARYSHRHLYIFARIRLSQYACVCVPPSGGFVQCTITATSI